MSDLDLGVYEEAFRSIDAPALITDTDLLIRDVNEAGLSFTGYESDELLGSSATLIAGDEEIYAEIVETVLEGTVWSGDFELRTKDGNGVFGRGSVAPLVLDGETRGYVAIFIDTTKQRRYENTAEVLNRLLRHDLRNELNVAYGNLQNAQSRIDDDETAAYLDQVNGALTRLIGKSERAHNLGELLEGSYEAENHLVRLDYVLHEAVVEAIETFDGAEFRFEAFPAVRVVADDLLATVFTVVLENSVVHNDASAPVVDIEVEEREEDVIVRVRDNGPGIREGEEDLIFGREERDQLHHGSGISLFFADNVIKSYDGDIRVDTDETEGATVEIRLDKARSD
ncbi:adaptive-response sensory-kinase SasA [Halalkalicoccus paucihalophilus]|uniref:histidine kinase n=1 Tax=Halalkalicoccus paucihalophilus TaxID=1008153 RepID=A0A151ACN5_9EURY|nr:PAS domain-containing sensor histidine kinase [Halalkalicoccus paucihalophilus]KYH25389.1 adaptive-response sensory-kinase SasA [Halalkalicoccus paucihalophilus]